MVFAAGPFFGENTAPECASRFGHAAAMARPSPGRLPTPRQICLYRVDVALGGDDVAPQNRRSKRVVLS
jgi:hypothetical protein